MKRIIVGIIGFAVVLLSLNAAYAQIPPHEGKGSRDKPDRRILQQLNLTEEQQKKLEENQLAQRQKMKESIAAMKEAQAKLQEALKDPNTTRATVEPILKEIKNLQAQMIDNRTDGIFAVKQILTPEQFTQFQELTQKHKQGMRERFGNWWQRRRHMMQDEY